MKTGSPSSSWRFSSSGSRRAATSFFDHHAAADDAAHEEAQDAQDQQRAGETAGPIHQAGVAANQIAEEAPSGHQRAEPGRGADGVEEQKLQRPFRSGRPREAPA